MAGNKQIKYLVYSTNAKENRLPKLRHTQTKMPYHR